VQKALEQI
jgi:hypothetical protein